MTAAEQMIEQEEAPKAKPGPKKKKIQAAKLSSVPDAEAAAILKEGLKVGEVDQDSPKVMVNYKKPGATIHTFWMPNPTDVNKLHGELIRMITGINQFEKKFVDFLKKDPEFISMIDEDFVEIIEAVKGHEEAPGIMGYEEKKALQLIKKCFNRDQLRIWLHSETRMKVKMALEDQIEMTTLKLKKK